MWKMRARLDPAEARLESSLSVVGFEGIVYVTERQMQPIAATIPVVITRPEAMDAAVAQLLSVN